MEAIEVKRDYIFSRMVEVGANSTELAVKLSVNPEKATVKITSSLTTKQIHLSNKEVNESVRKQLSEQIQEATELAINKMLEFGVSNSDEDLIDFPDKDEISESKELAIAEG